MSLNVKKLRYWLVVIVLGIAVCVGVKFFTLPAVAPEGISGVGHFSLIIDYGDKRDAYENILFGSGETAFSATQELTNREGIGFNYENYGDMGMLVVGIGGKGGGDTSAYWQYWVNGEYAQVGAGAYEIQDGDQIEWRFTDAQQ
jgi:hypothetical protein